MSDFEGLTEQARDSSWGPGPRCQVHQLLQFLPGEDAEHVEKALADIKVTNTGLHRALQSRMGDSPWIPSIWSIGNHRRGNCRCGSERVER